MMLHVSAIGCDINDSTHHILREMPVFVIVYIPLYIVVKNLPDYADNYKRDVPTINELLCLTVIAQNYMEMFVCGGLRQSRGWRLVLSFGTVCKYGIC